MPKAPDAAPVTLQECPPGLFDFNGTLCFKSEYMTALEDPRRYQCDAYVVESGEYFWGGATNTFDRGKLRVTPICTPVPTAAHYAALKEAREALEWALPYVRQALYDRGLDRIKAGHTSLVATYKNGTKQIGLHQDEVDKLEFARAALDQSK